MGDLKSIKADVFLRCLDMYDPQLGHRGYSAEDLRRRTNHLCAAFEKYENLKWIDLNRYDDEAVVRLTLDLDLRGVEVEKLGLADKLPARTDLYDRWFNRYLTDSEYHEYLDRAHKLSSEVLHITNGATYDEIFKRLEGFWNSLNTKSSYPDSIWFYMTTVESFLCAIVSQKLDAYDNVGEYHHIFQIFESLWETLELDVSAAQIQHMNDVQHNYNGLWNELQYVRMYLQFKAKSQLEQQVQKLAKEQYLKLLFTGYWGIFTRKACSSVAEAMFIACALQGIDINDLYDPNRNRIINQIKKTVARREDQKFDSIESIEELVRSVLNPNGKASDYMTSKTFRQLAEVYEFFISLKTLGFTNVHLKCPVVWIAGFQLLFGKDTDIKVLMSRVDNPSAGMYAYSMREVAKELIAIRPKTEAGEAVDYDYRHEALLHYWSFLLYYFECADIEKYVARGKISATIQEHFWQLLKLGDNDKIFKILQRYLSLVCEELEK